MAERVAFMSSMFILSNPLFDSFLNILSASKDEFSKLDTDSVNVNEFSKLSTLSRRHSSDYYLFLFFQQFPHLISQEQMNQIRERITRQAVRSLNQLNVLILICSSLNNNNIKYTIIKGPHLARTLYGNESTKVSVDLDIMMVNPNDLSDFNRILADLDFACTEKKLLTGSWKQKLYIAAKREVHYFSRIAGCAVDLHVKPFANTILTQWRHRNFFSDLERIPFEGITIPVLPPEKYFVYLCHHGACHQFARLGWLMDIRNFYDQRKEILVMDKILSVAGSMNTKRSVTLAFYMLEALFHDPVPEKIKQTTDRSGTLEWLAVNCLKAVSHEKGEGMTLKARFDRIVYLVKLTKGFAGKVDVVLSVLLRHLVLLLFGPKG